MAQGPRIPLVGTLRNRFLTTTRDGERPAVPR